MAPLLMDSRGKRKKQVGNVTKSNEEDGIWEVVKGL